MEVVLLLLWMWCFGGGYVVVAEAVLLLLWRWCCGGVVVVVVVN